MLYSIRKSKVKKVMEMKLETAGARLRYIINKDYGTIEKFTKAINISRQQIHRYLKDVDTLSKNAVKNIRELGYNELWIQYGIGEIYLEKKENDNIDNANKQGTIFDKDSLQKNVTGNELSKITMPKMNTIYLYPYSLNIGSIFEHSMIGNRVMFVSDNYDINKVIAFQNAKKEIPEYGIRENSTILVDITLNPIENDVVVAVKNGELILDVYNKDNRYDKIVGVMIEVNTKTIRR